MKKIISILLTIIMGIACFGFLAACGGEEVGPQWTTTGELVKDEDGNIVATGVTDENGIAVFTLRYGKYTYGKQVSVYSRSDRRERSHQSYCRGT